MEYFTKQDATNMRQIYKKKEKKGDFLGDRGNQTGFLKASFFVLGYFLRFAVK